jgi:hypothetical protein
MESGTAFDTRAELRQSVALRTDATAARKDNLDFRRLEHSEITLSLVKSVERIMFRSFLK